MRARGDPTLHEIVKAFVERDYALDREVPSVEKPSAATATHVANYIAGYGETLIELPDETWETSVAQWNGARWDVMVDLWTAEAGCEMILSAEVFEREDGFSYRVYMVHVP